MTTAASAATCNEETCTERPKDFVRIAMTTVLGAMTVEVLLCEMHIATMEMQNHGQFLYVRPRERLDL